MSEMNTHEQFADDLVLYALDELTGSERSGFEQHLETCASCRRDLQALRGDLGLLALSTTGPQPPAHSKDRLLRAVAAEPRGVSAPAQAPAIAPRRSLWWAWIPAVAAIALAVVAGNLHRSNTALRDQLAEVVNRYQDLNIQYKQTRQQVALLTAPDSVQVALNSGTEARKPHATAIYSPSQKRMILMANHLAPVPEGKAYELWVIPTAGAPINAGVFKPDEHGNAVMMDHAMPEGVVAKAFAVTLEDEAGSDKPTSPVLIVGMAGEGQ